MLDWLRWAFSNPYSTPHGFIAYLGVPFFIGLATAVIMRKSDAGALAVSTTAVSLAVFFAIYISLSGVTSTVPIGVAIAVVPFAIACTIGVMTARLIQRAVSGR